MEDKNNNFSLNSPNSTNPPSPIGSFLPLINCERVNSESKISKEWRENGFPSLNLPSPAPFLSCKTSKISGTSLPSINSVAPLHPPTHSDAHFMSLENCFSNSIDLSSEPTSPQNVETPSYETNSAGDDSVWSSEDRRKKCKLSTIANTIRSKLQQMIINCCNVKVERLNIMKEIIQNQDYPERLQELKPKHQELLTKEQRLCHEIQVLKGSSAANSSVNHIYDVSTPPLGPSPNSTIEISHSPVSTPIQTSNQLPPINLVSPGRSPVASPLPVLMSMSAPPSPVNTFNPNPTPSVPNDRSRAVWTGNISFSKVCNNNKRCLNDLNLYCTPPDMSDITMAILINKFENCLTNNTPIDWPPVINVTGATLSSNMCHFKKFAQRILILYAAEDSQNQEGFSRFLLQLNTNKWSAVVDLPNNTLLLTPIFGQNKILVIVLVKMNITHALRGPMSEMPLPTIPPSRPSSVVVKYYQDGEIAFDEKLVDGFYDPGRCQALQPLEDMRRQSAVVEREVLLVDSKEDPQLLSYVQKAEKMVSRFVDCETQARVLALFVANCLGGDSATSQSSIDHIRALKMNKQSNVILLGEIKIGVCRHRAILYKYLCDRLDLPCMLKRGTYTENSVTTQNGNPTGPHAWNIIKLGMQYFCVDVMHEPTQLYAMDSEKARNYTHAVQKTPGFKEAEVNNRPELSSGRRFVRLPNLRGKPVFHERLGRGNSTVYRATLGGLSCAIKKIDLGQMSEQQRYYSLQEVQVMEMLQHDNIIHYLGHELLEDKHELHIYMELFPFSLSQLIERRRKNGQKFSTSEIKHLAIEILNGMDYLHSKQIWHRDLKPDNILVDLDENDHVNKLKITDFGVCKIIRSDCKYATHTRVGTELYMSPELRIESFPCSSKIDIWAFGIILLELLTLAPPYSNLPRSEAIELMKNGSAPPIPDPSFMSQDEQRIAAIISKCLQTNPSERPTAEEVVLSLFRLQVCTKNSY